jgi:hypothetical protein
VVAPATPAPQPEIIKKVVIQADSPAKKSSKWDDLSKKEVAAKPAPAVVTEEVKPSPAAAPAASAPTPRVEPPTPAPVVAVPEATDVDVYFPLVHNPDLAAVVTSVRSRMGDVGIASQPAAVKLTLKKDLEAHDVLFELRNGVAEMVCRVSCLSVCLSVLNTESVVA